MSLRPHGRASVDPDNPRCWATCDRCGCLTNLHRLSWQAQWSGNTLINLKLLVCESCLDEPAPFLRSLALPADPPPIFNARVEPYDIDETDYRVTTDGSIRETEISDQPRVTENDSET